MKEGVFVATSQPVVARDSGSATDCKVGVTSDISVEGSSKDGGSAIDCKKGVTSDNV